MLKVLHLSTSDLGGGAAKGAYSLHRALCDGGIDSRMAVLFKISDDDTVFKSSHSAFTGFILKVLAYLKRKFQRVFYEDLSSPQFSTQMGPGLYLAPPDFKPDIIHLHWVCGDYLSLSDIASLPVPVVWTLRDMWPITGGCHYSHDCKKYESHCSRCFQLGGKKEKDLSWEIFEAKKKLWSKKNIHLTSLSKWLVDCGEKSPLFGGRSVTHIPNVIETKRFAHVNRKEARKQLGLKQETRYILTGGYLGPHQEIKGWQLFVPAMKKFAEDWSFSNSSAEPIKDCEVLIFGSNAPDNPVELGVSSRYVGHISKEEELALYYSAADVFVAPSLQESFCKTVAESLACGTPVVAFDATGPKDIIAHKKWGYKAKAYDVDDLAAGVKWCLNNNEGNVLGLAGIEHVKATYAPKVIAPQYISLYDEILKSSRNK